jgi:hypothetical protein
MDSPAMFLIFQLVVAAEYEAIQLYMQLMLKRKPSGFYFSTSKEKR